MTAKFDFRNKRTWEAIRPTREQAKRIEQAVNKDHEGRKAAESLLKRFGVRT